MTQRVGKEGETYGSYVLMSWLGGGGNADVWRASGVAGEVALKLLRQRRTESDAFRRFAREIEHLDKLGETPGVLPIRDYHLPDSGTGERAWLAMPVAVPMRDALGVNPSLPSVLTALADIADVLAGLHQAGISHRDVKPENLYQFADAWVIGDFGLVDAPDVAPLTVGGTALGPRYYLAPEMLSMPESADGAAADVYSLAKTIWVMATGQSYPPPGEHRLDVPGLQVASFVSGPRVALLDALLVVMTSHEAARRPSMLQVAHELRSWLSPDPTASQDLGDVASIAERVAAASRPALTHRQIREQRQQDVQDMYEDYVKIANPLGREIKEAGLPVFSGYGSELFFCTDASDLLPQAIGPLATMTVLGTEPTVSRAAGLLLTTEEDLPSLKIWIGVALIQGRSEMALVSGASVLRPRLGAERLWSEVRTVVVNGPSAEPTMNGLVSTMRGRLKADLDAWAIALEGNRLYPGY